MSADTTGVAVLAALLTRVARGENLQVSEFAAEAGFARATSFAISRRLREHGLVVADAERGLAAGTVLQQFAWAAIGLPELAGPAEAVLRWLLEHVDGFVVLSHHGEALLALGDSRLGAGDTGVVELTESVGAVEPEVRLTLRLAETGRDELAFAQRCLGRAALTLAGYRTAGRLAEG